MIAHGHLPAGGPVPAALRQFERWVLHWPARLLPSSANFAKELLEVWRIPPARVVLLADGIDPEFIRPRPTPDRLREELGLVGKRVVLYLGVLTEYQGIDDLLLAWPRVMAAVPDAHLLIVGHPNVEHYRARAAELTPAGSVTLTGRVDYEKTPDYLALGDVGVSAKHVSTEANGKLLNYMAMGLPAVAYDGPVSRELLGDAGVFAPMRDVPALAAALAGLLRDPHEQKLRGQALRERVVTHFGWPALGRRLVDVYRTCLEER
jgi:glycosyltransferase involved in cell wall biosynthesis